MEDKNSTPYLIDVDHISKSFEDLHVLKRCYPENQAERSSGYHRTIRFREEYSSPLYERTGNTNQRNRFL